MTGEGWKKKIELKLKHLNLHEKKEKNKTELLLLITRERVREELFECGTKLKLIIAFFELKLSKKAKTQVLTSN